MNQIGLPFGLRLGTHAKWSRLVVGVDLDVDAAGRWALIEVLVGPFTVWAEAWKRRNTDGSTGMEEKR